MAPIGNGHHLSSAQDCILCGQAMHGDAPLCAQCDLLLARAPNPACPRCARPSPTGTPCGTCLNKNWHFDSVRAVFRYTYPFDHLLQAYKYGHRLTLADGFGKALATAAPPSGTIDILLPMPLHPARLRQRGFNQSLELARPIGRRLAITPQTDLLERQRDTAPQADQPPDARRRNVRQAFHCRTDITGANVLLIDDVMTSGATLDEAARTLKLHGASRVDALVLARALPSSDI